MFYRKVRLIVQSASDVRNTLEVGPLTPHPSCCPLDFIRQLEVTLSLWGRHGPGGYAN
jgi:hypothetical protein